MATSPAKLFQSASKKKPVIVSVVAAACFTILVVSSLNSLQFLQDLTGKSSQTPPSTSRCPVIVYNKQIKTGSTVIANILYRTTEAYGCYNAGCRLHQLLMNGNSSHIGARNGVTLTCHAKEQNENIVPTLRATYGKEFAYIASVREPIGWFSSAACFFYRQQVDSHVKWTDEGYKNAIDWLLKTEAYEPTEIFLFRSLGLYPTSSKAQVMEKLLQYDLIIDHASMSEGLEELGKLLRWELLESSQSKGETYRGPLYNTYRVDEVKKRTLRVARLYEAATEIRKAKHERPRFAVEEAPKLVMTEERR